MEFFHNLRTKDCLVYEIQEEVELDKLKKIYCIQQMDLLLAKQSTVCFEEVSIAIPAEAGGQQAWGDEEVSPPSVHGQDCH